MSRVELVIFDCDGVLVDTETISNRVLAQTLTDAGLPTTLEEAMRDYKGLLLSDVGLRAARKHGRPLPGEWLTRFRQDRAEAFRAGICAIPGAAQAVQAVRDAGIGVCVASQGEPEKTELTLGLTGLRDLFAPHALFSAYLVPRGKPHPDLFLHAAATMGSAPARCAVVEDSPIGVAAAVAAGMVAIGYATDGDESSLRGVGAEIVYSMGDVPTTLGIR